MLKTNELKSKWSRKKMKFEISKIVKKSNLKT
jgi:hypothetical protein